MDPRKEWMATSVPVGALLVIWWGAKYSRVPDSERFIIAQETRRRATVTMAIGM